MNYSFPSFMNWSIFTWTGKNWTRNFSLESSSLHCYVSQRLCRNSCSTMNNHVKMLVDETVSDKSSAVGTGQMSQKQKTEYGSFNKKYICFICYIGQLSIKLANTWISVRTQNSIR